MSKLTEGQKEDILAYKKLGYSSRSIAALVLGSSSKKSTINDFIAREAQLVEEKSTVKKGPVIKILDVETSPELVFTFRRFKAFISPEQVVERGFLLSYSSADLKTGEVTGKNLTDFPLFEINNHDDYALCLDLWKELDDADIIIAHNGVKFDKAYISQRFAFHGLTPPSHYVVIDTLKAVKKTFALPSNALKEVALYFDTENSKLDNEGFPLWKQCWDGDKEAFSRMQIYNDGDVVSLRDLYLKILAWIPQHPNLSAYYKDADCRCSRCGSPNVTVIPNKYYHTAVSTFEIVRCSECGGQSRGRVNLRSQDKKANTIVGI